MIIIIVQFSPVSFMSHFTCIKQRYTFF